MSELTRSQTIDALRRHFGETEQQAADRIGISKRTVNTFINHPDKIRDAAWIKILNAYSVDAEGAKAIAESMPVLKKSAVQLETERRAAELAAKPSIDENTGRDPMSRKPGEKRWWHDSPRWFLKGEQKPPVSFDPNQKVYSYGQALILNVIDVMEIKGREATREAILQSAARNTIIRTPETSAEVWAKHTADATIQFERALEQGDIIRDGETYHLAEHVYESIVQCAVGDPRWLHPSRVAGQTNTEYMPFADRYELIEELEGESLPEKSQHFGIAITEEEANQIWKRTMLPRVEPKKENTSDLI